MWIQNQELGPKTNDKSLETLLANCARSLTGAGFYAESNIFSVLGLKALTARIRIVNLDQLKVNPKHPGDTVQVTLLKDYQHLLGRITFARWAKK